jgi:hypothetical protein
MNEKAPYVVAEVALKNISLPRAVNRWPSPGSYTIALIDQG